MPSGDSRRLPELLVGCVTLSPLPQSSPIFTSEGGPDPRPPLPPQKAIFWGHFGTKIYFSDPLNKKLEGCLQSNPSPGFPHTLGNCYDVTTPTRLAWPQINLSPHLASKTSRIHEVPDLPCPNNDENPSCLNTWHTLSPPGGQNAYPPLKIRLDRMHRIRLHVQIIFT